MRHRWICSTAAAVVLALSGPAVGQSIAGGGLTAAVRTAVDRGELLYIYDQAAWHGTDAIRNHYSSLLSEVGGYVVTGDEGQAELVFFDKSKTRAVFRAIFANGRMAKNGPAAADRVHLTQLERRLIGAKELALNAMMAAKVGLCSMATPNLAALPPENRAARSSFI